MRFWVVFRSERAVSTIFPPYIMPHGTYERIKKISDTPPLNALAFITVEKPQPQGLPKCKAALNFCLSICTQHIVVFCFFVFAFTTPVSLVDFLLQKEMLIGDRRRDTERDSGASQAEELNFQLI